MQAANKVFQSLKSGQSFGTWIMLPGANLARMVARTGYDWICVDTEHGNIDDAQMHESVAAISACGVSPIVRIADNQSWMVKRALDTGAHGIVVPLINTAADCKRLVEYAKFPPTGTRGFGSPFSHDSFGLPNNIEYLKQANDAILTIVQIETKEALENVDEIAKVPGVDVLFVGPFDLGNNIGHPYLNPFKMPDELAKAVAKVLKACKDNGKKGGMFCVNGEQAKQYADLGWDLVSVTFDATLIPTAFKQALAKAKGQ